MDHSDAVRISTNFYKVLDATHGLTLFGWVQQATFINHGFYLLPETHILKNIYMNCALSFPIIAYDHVLEVAIGRNCKYRFKKCTKKLQWWY